MHKYREEVSQGGLRTADAIATPPAGHNGCVALLVSAIGLVYGPTEASVEGNECAVYVRRGKRQVQCGRITGVSCGFTRQTPPDWGTR